MSQKPNPFARMFCESYPVEIAVHCSIHAHGPRPRRPALAFRGKTMTTREMAGPGDAESPSKKRRPDLAEQSLIGLVLGLAVGIFFGEMAAFLKVFGNAFILLLQMTVIPYITVSLITALGRLTLDDAKMLGLKAGSVLLVLWAIGLAVVLLAPLAFPDWPSASFFSTSQLEEAEPVDFLNLYIPANPFSSLANAVVPAIVVFSVLIGLALINVRNKKALLDPLAAVADALMGVTGMVARLAPYGIFALTARAAGTIDIEELSRLQVYVVTYIVLALILGFWLLPGLVTAVTPLTYASILRAFRGALITAFATGNVLIVLPILAAESKSLIGDLEERTIRREEREAQSSIDILIPAAFNFPTLGAVLTLMFVLFAGWYIGTAIPASQYPTLAVAGLASLFGGTVLAIPFLLDLLQLPQDLFQLFITVDVLGSRFGTLLAAMHIVTIALIGTFALHGRARVRLVPLVRFAAISIALLAVALIGIRMFYSLVVVAPYTMDEALRGIHLIVDPQPATVLDNLTPQPGQTGGGEPAGLAGIRDRGTLRVCFTRDDFPAAFFNDADPPQLVGFDIEMAHRFARSLELPIAFVPTDNDREAAQRLDAGACDIVASGNAVIAERTETFALTLPVFRSSAGLVVRDHDRDAFQSWDDLRDRGVSLRLAVPADALAQARSLLPQATFIPIYSTQDLQEIYDSDAMEVDAIAYLSEEGAAWTLLYPRFSLVVPRPTMFLPVAYAVAPGNDTLLNAFNAWLINAQANGTVDALYRYWMLGEAATTQRPPRWSVIRNVLHWVD
jgi:Na+/H+-dicarboxylate symporter/ABC-type amino acid transport substrate-binding protein